MFKIGDWNCYKCNYMNFSYRKRCKQCFGYKQIQLPGDWTCSCGEYNFSYRLFCRRCQKEK